MKKESKQHEVLRWASLFLEEHNREPRVAELLLQHYMEVSRSEFYMRMHDPVPPAVISQFEAAVKKHAETGIPIQHLIGYEYFYGRKFRVNEHTLIPRPETEELVQQVIKSAPATPHTIIDIGTGSGIIAITLALEIPHATVYASDISDHALTIARRNAESLNANVQFRQGDFLKPFHGEKADIIVSNPPYISRSEEKELSDTVKDFDPELALFAEDNGLAAYKKITAHLKNVSEPGAQVFFEIGHEQGDAVSSLIKREFPQSSIQIIQDINKKDRIVKAELKF
ncbi:peptide chain release factor N(5)-glutamine methyltransferase [Virgibacillus kekensis]|uniref:Release factor glutamine methyltransferase n=1 Tax=Virgibacillus kekensis TaxID=202261 RepID=A0ABV9DGZ1_9BACI